MNSAIRAAALAASVASAFAGSAFAANVTLYGRVDTGVIVNRSFGDSASRGTVVSMNSGVNTASRWGLKGTEKLSDDTDVLFQLENRFTSDDGSFKTFSSGKAGRMFGGQAFAGVKSKTFGQVTFGRNAGSSSGSGAYDLQYYMDAFGGGTNGTGNAPVKAGRYDNTVTWRTPMLQGFQGTFMYSMKGDGYDEGDENTSDVNRYWSAALRYAKGPMNLVAIAEGTAWGHAKQIDQGASTSRKLFTVGGSYRFQPVTVYAQAQYWNGANRIDGFKADPSSSIEGWGLYAGTQFWMSGLSSWQSMVYYKDYSLNKAGASFDGKSIGVATKYLYRPSKTIDMYVGGGFSQWDRVSGGRILTDKNLNAFLGLTKYF